MGTGSRTIRVCLNSNEDRHLSYTEKQHTKTIERIMSASSCLIRQYHGQQTTKLTIEPCSYVKFSVLSAL